MGIIINDFGEIIKEKQIIGGICLKRLLWLLLSVTILSLSTCSMPSDDITKMSSMEMIQYNTKGVKKAAITVGIVQNGQMTYKVYGENGRELSQREHIYEIGSITKTFTAILISKAISEGKVSLNDSINTFLDLPSINYYPIIRRLLTHTSGYKSTYYEGYVSTNFLNSGNPFYGITEKSLIARIKTIGLDNRDYSYEYSNFGMAVLGLTLEKLFNKDYTHLMNDYIKNELGLNNTIISNGNGDLSNYWIWDCGNPYIAAGAISSNVTDMMRYAQLQMDENPSYLSISHNVLAEVTTPPEYVELGIRIDAVGASWLIDTANNIIWHNGGTSNSSSYLGFDKTNGVAVVVLSNMAPGFRINVTLIGTTLLKELK